MSKQKGKRKGKKPVSSAAPEFDVKKDSHGQWEQVPFRGSDNAKKAKMHEELDPHWREAGDVYKQRKHRTNLYFFLAAISDEVDGMIDKFSGDHHISRITQNPKLEKHFILFLDFLETKLSSPGRNEIYELEQFVSRLEAERRRIGIVRDSPVTDDQRRRLLDFAQNDELVLEARNFLYSGPAEAPKQSEVQLVTKEKEEVETTTIQVATTTIQVEDVKYQALASPLPVVSDTTQVDVKVSATLTPKQHFLEYNKLKLLGRGGEKEAQENLELAAKGKYPKALYLTAFEFYKKGNHEEAHGRLREAAKEGDVSANIELGRNLLMSNEDKQAKQCLEKAIEASGEKNSNAWFFLGMIHHRELKNDMGRINELRSQISKASSPITVNIGIGSGAKERLKEKLAIKLAEKRNEDIKKLEEELKKIQETVPESVKETIAIFEKSAWLGDVDACLVLREMGLAEENQQKAKDIELRVFKHKIAREKIYPDDPEIAHDLAICYSEGIGTEKNLQLTCEYFKRAIKNSDEFPDFQNELRFGYLKLLVSTRDVKEMTNVFNDINLKELLKTFRLDECLEFFKSTASNLFKESRSKFKQWEGVKVLSHEDEVERENLQNFILAGFQFKSKIDEEIKRRSELQNSNDNKAPNSASRNAPSKAPKPAKAKKLVSPEKQHQV